jgi:hypothetical protein
VRGFWTGGVRGRWDTASDQCRRAVAARRVRELLRDRKLRNRPFIQTMNWILGQFGLSEEKAHGAYRAFVSAGRAG